MLLCITLAEVLVIFTDADMRIKDIQIGDHKIKTAKFADDAAIFLRDFICLTKMKLILELGEKASSSKLNFSKSQTLWSVAYKNRADKPRQMAWSQFGTKIVGAHFCNSAHDNMNWYKRYHSLTKKILI